MGHPILWWYERKQIPPLRCGMTTQKGVVGDVDGAG
jgi:hypothetical protein